MPDTTLEEARARYLSDLQRTHPVFDEQLTEIIHLLDSLLKQDCPPLAQTLAPARADYLARLRERGRSRDEQVRDLAKACADLFAAVLGLPVPVPLPSGSPRAGPALAVSAVPQEPLKPLSIL
jgi:hypothetical protein